MTATLCFVLIILSIAYSYKLIINNCKHEWDEIDKKELKSVVNHGNGNTTNRIFIRYHLKCKKCGHLKYEDL